MSNIDSPALFDPALFWGVWVVILFCFSLRGFASSRELITLPSVPRCLSVISREAAKPRRRGLKGRVKLQRTLPLPKECVGFTFIHRRARLSTTTDNPLHNPNTLRGFASSRELKTLPSVPRCPSVISREAAKPRRWGLKRGAKLRQTLPLPEESGVLRRIEHRHTGTHNAHPQSSFLMHLCKTIDHERPTPNTLRGFASSREMKTLPSVPRCLSVISREDAKPRRRGFKMRVKLQRTLPLPEESVGSAFRFIKSTTTKKGRDAPAMCIAALQFKAERSLEFKARSYPVSAGFGKERTVKLVCACNGVAKGIAEAVGDRRKGVATLQRRVECDL
jgi:hypothetical protein